jgi:hypothetical protein
VTPIPGTDIFASMPRITPFTDFELEPVDAPGEASVVTPSSSWSPGTGTPAEPRRGGRHSSPDEEPDGARSGGRRHRSDDSPNDILARILERERR